MLKALLLGTCTAGLLAACATAPTTAIADRTAATAPGFTPGVDCLTTGTRIRLKEGECANVAGRSFTQDEIQRTGAIDTVQALRMLDPSFTR
jgi:hypothetical protein